jgi:hypothetical protein
MKKSLPDGMQCNEDNSGKGSERSGDESTGEKVKV